LVATRISALSGEQPKPAFDPNAGQSAMIRQMVERLDARLSMDGSDLEGWLKLMRAYQVLGDGPKANDAFSRAKLAKANDSDALAKLSVAAEELGIAD
jgi:cytochrome c-type biogenesis protein CcmH